MNEQLFSVDADIRRAQTLPADFYRDPVWFEQIREKVFARSWHYIGTGQELPEAGSVRPFALLPGYLEEPLVLTRDENGDLHCLSNVCTHRAKIVAEEAGKCRELRCRYHGRRFGLDGKMRFMPEFQDVENFPAREDSLPQLPLHQFGPCLFAAIDPMTSFEGWVDMVRMRVPWLPLEKLLHLPERDRRYDIKAHWALYVDNYLEGFHIPFVHPKLNQLLSYNDYEYELFPFGNLQLGIARDGEPHFDVPPDSLDAGRSVAAYYFWLFPNLMLNFYPWGLSLNLVEPKGPDRTEVLFQTFVWDDALYQEQAQSDLHDTEMEDEAVVESVQLGVQSRLYRRGRFSPKMEVAVHQFHRLLAEVVVGSR